MPPLVARKAVALGVPPLMDEIAPVQEAGTTHSLVVQTYPAKVQETAKERQEGLDQMKWLWMLLVPAVAVTALLGFWLFGQSSVLVKSLVTGYLIIPLVLIGLVAAVFWRGEFYFGRVQFTGAQGVPMNGRAFGAVVDGRWPRIRS